MGYAEFFGNLVEDDAHLARVREVGGNDQRGNGFQLLTRMAGDRSYFVALTGELLRRGQSRVSSASEKEQDRASVGSHCLQQEVLADDLI